MLEHVSKPKQNHNLKLETMCSKDIFLNLVQQKLSKLLTNDDNHISAFRIHNKQLTTLGDLSFQTNLNFAAWKQLNCSDKNCENIFDYASKLHKKTINQETILQITNEDDNNIKIDKCVMVKSNCHVFLNREYITTNIIKQIITDPNYGSYKLNIKTLVNTQSEVLSLSELRVKILHQIITNFVSNETDAKQNSIEVLLTTKSSDVHDNKILCGCVLNDKGQKEESLTSVDLYDEFSSNMRMMFEHKYGVRNITDKPNWKEKIEKLGHAAVTFQMIQNTPQKTISLASKHHVIKDAAFVIYNGARICSILRRFELEFGKQKELPSVDDIDFSNLKLNEEWELIYAYLAQYPQVIQSCACALPEGKLNFQKLYEFLVHLATAFSVYYSRIKIITEAKEHLMPALYARIYLLTCVERVLHNALKILNIQLVNQM